MANRPLVLIAGIGEGLGVSLATTFAAAGYDVAGISRSTRLLPVLSAGVGSAGGAYAHLTVDLTNESEIANAVPPLAERADVVIYAAHRLLIRPFAESSATDFDAVWRLGCLGAMLVARHAAPAMIARGQGTIIMTGATASMKGSARFSAFASAKFALRGFAQSLARELGPQGVHVAHVILDGLIDEQQTTARFGAASSLRMSADSIAASYLALARQDRSAWTHELDLRPFSEKF